MPVIAARSAIAIDANACRAASTTNAAQPASNTSQRSASSTDCGRSTDQVVETAAHALSSARAHKKATSSRPASVVPPAAAQTATTASSASALQPHDVGKYPPWSRTISTTVSKAKAAGATA